MKRTDRDWLLDALDHIDAMQAHLAAGESSEMRADAIAMRLSAAIDSVAQVSDEVRSEAIPETEWRQMKATRNRIAHAYRFVDSAMIEEYAENDIPSLIAAIRRMLELTPQ